MRKSASAVMESKEPSGGSHASFEERRTARLARKAALDAQAAKRPGPTDDHPPDVAAVTWAKEHMGDYRLKTSKEYRPKEGERVDATTKRRQLVELELLVHDIQRRFNVAVLTMRLRRASTLQALQSADAEIAAIEAALAALGVDAAASGALPFPTGHWAASAASAHAAHSAEPLSDLAARRLGTGGVQWSTDGRADAAEGMPTAASLLPTLDPFAFDVATLFPSSSPSGGDARWAFTALPAQPALAAATDAETATVQLRASLLLHRRAWLARQMSSLVTSFDAAISELSRERLRIQNRAASASLRLLVLSQELDLLRDMRKRDEALETRLNRVRGDKATVAASVATYTAQLAERKVELEGVASRDKALWGEFEELVGPSHPAIAALTKVYRRRVKRGKGDAAGGGKEGAGGDAEDEGEW